MDTRAPYTRDYAGPQGGKPARYMLRWVNSKGETGPWSETATATIGAWCQAVPADYTIAMLKRINSTRLPKAARLAQPAGTGEKPLNRSLSAAKAAKQDEFYTQYVDIQKDVEAYREYDPDTFRKKVVYCNCDDPFESNFFKYFAANFNKLRLKRLICTSYDGSPLAGQMTLFDEYNAGNGHRKKPKAIAVNINKRGATSQRATCYALM